MISTTATYRNDMVDLHFTVCRAAYCALLSIADCFYILSRELFNRSKACSPVYGSSSLDFSIARWILGLPLIQQFLVSSDVGFSPSLRPRSRFSDVSGIGVSALVILLVIIGIVLLVTLAVMLDALGVALSPRFAIGAPLILVGLAPLTLALSVVIWMFLRPIGGSLLSATHIFGIDTQFLVAPFGIGGVADHTTSVDGPPRRDVPMRTRLASKISVQTALDRFFARHDLFHGSMLLSERIGCKNYTVA